MVSNNEIWSDQPADPPQGIPFSHPLNLLWAYDFPNGTYIERVYGDPSPQGFYDPIGGTIEPANHQITVQYNFFVPEGEAFIQEEGTIYWLVVQVILDGPPIWGWKTTQDHWNDDSVLGATGWSCSIPHCHQSRKTHWTRPLSLPVNR